MWSIYRQCSSYYLQNGYLRPWHNSSYCMEHTLNIRNRKKNYLRFYQSENTCLQGHSPTVSHYPKLSFVFLSTDYKGVAVHWPFCRIFGWKTLIGGRCGGQVSLTLCFESLFHEMNGTSPIYGNRSTQLGSPTVVVVTHINITDPCYHNSRETWQKVFFSYFVTRLRFKDETFLLTNLDSSRHLDTGIPSIPVLRQHL